VLLVAGDLQLAAQLTQPIPESPHAPRIAVMRRVCRGMIDAQYASVMNTRHSWPGSAVICPCADLGTLVEQHDVAARFSKPEKPREVSAQVLGMAGAHSWMHGVRPRRYRGP
jgi:hypothetical protein